MKQVDTSGLLCPAPLIMMKRAINAAMVGDKLEVVADNNTSACNLADYLRQMKIEFTEESSGGRFIYQFFIPSKEVHASFHTPAATSYAIVIKSDQMGEGDEALGRILLRAYINALPELPHLPSAVILYNKGVYVATQEADTLEALQTIEQRGVRILACGTCLDYYHLKEKLAVGTAGNMYTIAELCAAAGHLVYP